MKNPIKISLIALCAMFAFNTTANAQFGGLKGLANKVKKAAKETVNNVANDAKNSVSQQAESTVSEATGINAGSNESETQSSSSEDGNTGGKYEFRNARQCDWTIDGDVNNIISCSEYYASKMQSSMKSGYKGMDYKAYCELMSAKQPLCFVLEARMDLGLGPNTYKAQQSKKDIDALIWDFKQEAWKGMPGNATFDKIVRLQQTKYIIDRGLSLNDPVARAAFFDMAYTYMQICIEKVDGTEGEWKSVEKGLNDLFGSMSEEYKSKFPTPLTLDAIKANRTSSANTKKTMAMQIAYKQTASEGKYGTMPASANPSMEKKALNAVQVHRAYWGKATKAWVGPVTSTKKNHLGQVITKYRSVKVLCEDQGYKVIHNFALYEKPADGSIQMTGFGWENGDKEIELAK